MSDCDCDHDCDVTVESGNSTSGNSSSGCFIATAAYGSYAEPHVLILREFRDNVLYRSALGRLFIRCYYKISPPIAALIAPREYVKKLVRCVLNRACQPDCVNRKSDFFGLSQIIFFRQHIDILSDSNRCCRCTFHNSLQHFPQLIKTVRFTDQPRSPKITRVCDCALSPLLRSHNFDKFLFTCPLMKP